MSSQYTRLQAVFAFMLAMCGLAYAHADARPIDEQQATRIALSHLSGSALKVEREHELGIFYFEVEVRADNGLVYDVNVAADDGRVLSIVLDD